MPINVLWANKGWNTIVEMVCVGKIAMDDKCIITQFIAIFYSWSLFDLQQIVKKKNSCLSF